MFMYIYLIYYIGWTASIWTRVAIVYPLGRQCEGLNEDKKTFDGKKHTVKNILVTEYALSETSIYTPAACVGFFAEAKSSSTIKDITVDGFEVDGTAAEAKWVGALVGMSRGASTYTDCHSKNVKIISESADSYRLGGLIGFINGTAGDVTLTSCSVTDVTIKGSFCIGGFVGALQGGTRSFVDCHVTNAALSVNANSSALHGAYSGSTFHAPYKWWGGYMSKFIGEANCSKIEIDNQCSITPNTGFTSEELTSFGYDDIASYSYAKTATDEEKTAAINGAKHYKLEDGNIFLPACVDKGTIIVAGTTLTDGTDYNKFTEITSSAE